MDQYAFLKCQLHQEEMTTYCSSKECPLETRICCYKCSEQLHQHQTSHISKIKDEAKVALLRLVEVIEKIQKEIQFFTEKGNILIKTIKLNADFLEDLINNFQSKNKRIQQICMSESGAIHIYRQHQAQNLLVKYQSYIEQNNNAEALKILESLIWMEPGSSNYIYECEQKRLMSMSQVRVPSPLRQSVRGEDREKQQLAIHSANSLLTELKYNEALDAFKKIISKDCKDYQAHHSAGVCLSKMGEFKKAIEYFNQSLALNPNQPESLYEKSQSLFELQNVIQLKLCFEDMKAINHPKIRLIEGQTLLLQKEIQKALNCFETMISEQNHDFDAIFYKAKSLITIGGNENLEVSDVCIFLLIENGYDLQKLKNLKILRSKSQIK